MGRRGTTGGYRVERGSGMGYVQMTLDEWVEIKQKLRQELIGVKQSFVRIGYTLRKIEEQRLYEQDGYKSVAEFAKAEYGLEQSTTSRFMSINREYSVDGYSETLRPEFADLGRSQLEEMLKLPEEDRKMIRPETSREEIRELKRFNRAEPETGVADGIGQLIENFFRDNRETLNAIFNGEDLGNTKRISEIINPGGNRSYRKGLFFLMMYENKISVKKYGMAPQEMGWEEFIQRAVEIFGDEAGPDTWGNHFGGTAEEPEKEEATEEVKEAVTEEVTEEVKEEVAEEVKEEAKEEVKENAPAHKNQEILEETPHGHGGKQEENAGKSKKEAGKYVSYEEAAVSYGMDQEEKMNDLPIEETPHGSEGKPKAEAAEEKEAGTTEAASEAGDIQEVIEKPFGSRKQYMETLSAHGMAEYMAEEYKRHSLKVSDLAYTGELFRWLTEDVDGNGIKYKPHD